MDKLHQIGKSLLNFTWTKSLLYWLIMSSGTMAECAFLLASLWMSINSSVHGFVRLFVSEDTTTHFSELATTAYVALPECILFLASVTVIGHVRVWWYDKKIASLVWSILYGFPTLIFLVLSLFTLGSSVLSVHFQMPAILVVARALAGYVFGFVAFLYWSLGVGQEVERLKEKDTLITNHVEDKRLLSERLETQEQFYSQQAEALKAEMTQQKRAIEESQAAQKRVIEEMQKTDDAALQAYGDECLSWLRSGIKTALVDEVSRFTGFSKRKIVNAIASSNLQTSARNKDLVLVSSLVLWLKNTPPPMNKNEPTLHIVPEQSA